MDANLRIYDRLRDMHNILKDMRCWNFGKVYEGLSDWEKNALEAVDSVLYLAEGAFTSPEHAIEHERK